MHDKAVASVSKAMALAGSSSHITMQLGQVYALAGEKAEAQKVIDRVQAESKGRYFSPLNIAMIYSISGEKDKAFLWLEKAYDDHTPWLMELGVEPAWDRIRSDPRFRDLQRRIGLPH
jgi:Flp pilus assembly protein TadD